MSNSCSRAKASIRWVSAAPRWAPRTALSSRAVALGSGGRRLLQQLQAAEHRHQEVVEVVCDAAGQLADGVQLL